MSLDLAAPLRTALVDDGGITALLGTWKEEPSVHTRRPAPADATFPMAMVSPDVALRDEDGLTSSRPVVTREIIFYGQNPDHYRAVEECGYLARDLFHRNRFAISVPGFQVISITAAGPIPAPTDDASLVARAVTLTLKLRRLV